MPLGHPADWSLCYQLSTYSGAPALPHVMRNQEEGSLRGFSGPKVQRKTGIIFQESSSSGVTLDVLISAVTFYGSMCEVLSTRGDHLKLSTQGFLMGTGDNSSVCLAFSKYQTPETKIGIFFLEA